MKKLTALLLLCAIIASIAGCNVDYSAMYSDNASIVKSSDSSYSTMSVYSTDDGEFNMYAKTFVGSKTIWSYNASDGDEVTINFSLSVGSGGSAKLVLIAPDNTITVLAENTDNTVTDEVTTHIAALAKGDNRIKIIGSDDPEITLVLNADKGKYKS